MGLKYFFTLALFLVVPACTSTFFQLTPTAIPTATFSVTPTLISTSMPTNTPKPTYTPTLTASPTPNGGGEHIIFLRRPPLSKGTFIGIINSDGENFDSLVDKSWLVNPMWSPDGSRIAFGYSYYYSGGPLYVVDVDGSDLFEVGLSKNFTWSSDGTKFAATLGVVKGGYEIFIIGIDGQNLFQLTHNDFREYDLAWSPTSNQIAFYARTFGVNHPNESDDSEIYVINDDGSNFRQLTNNDMDDYHPVWSLDGRRIAFISIQSGNIEIYVMDADGKNLHNISNQKAEDMCLAWSPNGKQIAFTSQSDDLSWEINVMDADGKNLRNITNDNNVTDCCPAWSPDSTQIAFCSDERNEHRSEISVMNSDGSNVHRLTDFEEGHNFEPVWQPSR